MAHDYRIQDDFRDTLERNIKRYGLSVIGVLEEDGAPSFSYTIGLTKTWGHPECLIFLPDLEIAQDILNKIAELIADGRRFSPGTSHRDILENRFACIFRHAGARAKEEFAIQACSYYGDRDFSVLQVVWPDKRGRFPHEPGFDPKLRRAQELLYLTGNGHA